MVNAYPTLFSQYAKKNKYACPAIDAYVADRKKFLTTKIEKKDVLKIMNGGGWGDLEKAEWLVNIQDETDMIMEKVVNDPNHLNLVKEAKKIMGKNASKHDIRRSVYTRLLCDIEAQCIEACKNYCFLNCNVPVEEFANMFDGFMLQTKYIVNTDTLSQYVEEITGYKVDMIEKTLDEGFDVPDFADYEVEGESDDEDEDDDLRTRDIFDKVMEMFPDRIKMRHGVLVGYDTETGMWNNRPRAIFSKLAKLAYPKSHGKSKKSIIDAFFFAEELPDDDAFFEKAERNTIGKLLFRDAVWDIENSCILNFSPDFYFIYRIFRGIPTRRDEANIRKIRKMLFEDPHPNPRVANEIMKQLAVALTGDNSARRLYGNIGPTGTGKSTNQKAFTKTYQGFTGVLNSKHLCVSKYAGKNDHADYIVDLQFKRVVYISEIDKGDTWSTKEVCSLTGDDAISARRCGLGADRPFFIQSTIFSYANGMADFSIVNDALRNRILLTEWKVQFKNNENRDTSCVKWVETDEACNALFWVMKDAYELYKQEGFCEVEEMQNYTKETADEQDEFKREFDALFELDKKGKVLITEVYEMLKEYSIKTTLIASKLLSIGVEKKETRNAGVWEGQKWAFIGMKVKV